MIKRIVLGVLLSSVVAAGTVCVSTLPASASEGRVLHGDVDAWQVTLQDGQRSTGDQSGKLSIKKSVDETLTADTFALEGASGELLSASTEYQIVMRGKPTGYWVKSTLFAARNGRASCEIYLGAPTARGSRAADPVPFTCWTSTTYNNSSDSRFTFHIGLNRDAEASGAISPLGGVSLAHGVYGMFELPYAIPGAPSVASGSAAAFDTVLRVGDTTSMTNQARNEFAYQIYNKGVPTDWWVAGVSTNYRDRIMFNGDGRCAIYENNPLANGKHLDQSTPVDGRLSPYTCTANGSYKSGPHEDGHGHFHAEFTVSTKAEAQGR